MKVEKKHYLLMKRSGLSADGRILSATDSAKALLEIGFWPLYQNTRCRKMVQPGHDILIYLAGSENDCQHVIASVKVKAIEPWSELNHRPVYPLMLDDIPSVVLIFENTTIFNKPVNVKSKLDLLSFVPKKNPKKWGAVLVGGMMSLFEPDFNLLNG